MPSIRPVSPSACVAIVVCVIDFDRGPFLFGHLLHLLVDDRSILGVEKGLELLGRLGLGFRAIDELVSRVVLRVRVVKVLLLYDHG